MFGGRMKFVLGQTVRIITLDGKVSVKEYEVSVETADGKGHVQLKEVGKNQIIKVNQRRIIPQSVNKDKAIVVESSNKYRAVCPNCPIVFDIMPDHTSIECPGHGKFELHWLGEKPVNDTTTQENTTDAAVTEVQPETTAKPNTVKKDKKVRTPIVVDLASLANLKGCELWTKGNVQFNHEKIAVATHALLWTEDNPRKLCWNTYDGTLGKKGKPLEIDAFCANDEAKATNWYNVKDLDKERGKLDSKGYVHET